MTAPGGAGPDPTANLLGAVALVVTDLSMASIGTASGLAPSAASAVSAMEQFLDRPTLDDLRRVLGLTPSGAVRLVDRLAAAGLVTRGPGADGRSRAVILTEAGRAAAARIAAARAGLLDGLLVDLSPTERDVLRGLLAKIMGTTVRIKDGGAWICRLCDLDACGRPAGACPAANAAAARWPRGPG